MANGGIIIIPVLVAKVRSELLLQGQVPRGIPRAVLATSGIAIPESRLVLVEIRFVRWGNWSRTGRLRDRVVHVLVKVRRIATEVVFGLFPIPPERLLHAFPRRIVLFVPPLRLLPSLLHGPSPSFDFALSGRPLRPSHVPAIPPYWKSQPPYHKSRL